MVCKGCGRCFIFVSCLAQSTWPPLRKGKFPSLRCGIVSLKEPKFETFQSTVVWQSILEGPKAGVLDKDGLEKTTDSLLDTKRLSNLKAKINKENNPAGHSFEAVAHLKRKSDEKDEFFIYKMNDRHMNPDEPSFGLKTSKLKISIALSIGDEEHFLSNEYCYIDGKWNSCKDFPTVTLSVCHPVLRK